MKPISSGGEHSPNVTTFFELTTVSSIAPIAVFPDPEEFVEVVEVTLGRVLNVKLLCSFFSRTVGSSEEAEATEGRERRPRVLEGSLLSPVESVEVLADEECRLSLDCESLRADPDPDPTRSHSISSLKVGSISKNWQMMQKNLCQLG